MSKLAREKNGARLGKTWSLFGARKQNKKQGRRKEPLAAGPSETELSRSRGMLQAKIPTPEPLIAMLQDIIYVKPFSEVNKDILRLIRRVTLHIEDCEEDSEGGKSKEKVVKPEDLGLPDHMKGHAKEGVYLVLLLMQQLLRYFETTDVANNLCDKLDAFYEQWADQENFEKKEAPIRDDVEGESMLSRLELRTEAVSGVSSGAGTTLSEMQVNELGEDEIKSQSSIEFSVPELVQIIGGDKTRTALAVRCIHQSVAITGHMHIKAKVCPYLTKDVRSSNGWQVEVRLNRDAVEITHRRRESSVDMPGLQRNHWEMEFTVDIALDKLMKEITGAKLTITDLELSETMDDELAKYLRQRFNNGNLVVC